MRDLKIANLATDLSDGLKLINLLEEISAKRLPKYTKVVKFHNQKLENVGIALKFLKDEGLKLVAIGPEGMIPSCTSLMSLFVLMGLQMLWSAASSLSWVSSGLSFSGGKSRRSLIKRDHQVVVVSFSIQCSSSRGLHPCRKGWGHQGRSACMGQPRHSKEPSEKFEQRVCPPSLAFTSSFFSYCISWQDGKALAALTNYLRPKSVTVTGSEEV